MRKATRPAIIATLVELVCNFKDPELLVPRLSPAPRRGMDDEVDVPKTDGQRVGLEMSNFTIPDGGDVNILVDGDGVNVRREGLLVSLAWR
jgi:hypothetical protein